MKQIIAAMCIAVGLLLTGCGESAEAVDNTAAESSILKDGVYESDEITFHWSGGSGRVELTCEKVTIEKGEATAEITFSSPNYSYAKIGETELEGTYTEETSTFQVPVTLGEEIELVGCTTAMSTPHEITYTIRVSIGEEGGTSEAENDTAETSEAADTIREEVMTAVEADEEDEIPEIEGLTFAHQMELTYAKSFDVYYYEDDYKVITMKDNSQYLIVPEGAEVPENLEENVTVLQQPLSNVYVAATSSMSLFNAIGELDQVKMTGTDVSGWEIEAPREALQKGTMLYAGKYSEPDYELLLSENCDLAVESTMILHAPDVREQLNTLGIPVWVDWSSYESDVMGRMEWIKAYGALMNREDEAEQIFEAELQSVGDGYETTGKTVAYFSINSARLAQVHRPNDYISKMIEMAGGINVFSDIDESAGTSASIALSIEEFYTDASEADVLIYNGNINSDVKSIEDLIAKNELFADFKAVKEGNVYLSGSLLYQSTDCAIEFVNDIHSVLTDDENELIFLEKLSE